MDHRNPRLRPFQGGACCKSGKPKSQGILPRLWRSLIRTFFHLLYGQFAWAYDAVAWLVSFGQWRCWARTALRHTQGPRILELGHGPGHLQVAMAQGDLAPVGLDLSPQMGRLARSRMLRAGFPPRLVRARAQALPFRDNSFPEIVATFPTEFIVDPRTLREIRRVLPGGGKVVVVAAGLLTGKDPLSRLMEWLYRITGQREPLARGNEPLWAEGGMSVQTEWIRAARSRVLVVVGKRAPAKRSSKRSEGTIEGQSGI